MALVITIIVLIILASISIAMISGNNSIINRTGKAKEDTERVQIEEALNVAYISLEGRSISSTDSAANLDDAVEIVQNQGYKDRIVGVSGGAYKLNKENVILSKTSPDNTDTISLEKDTSAESGGTWYAIIMGRYFKIEEKNGDIKVAKEPSNVNPSSGASGDTINITSSDVTIANTNIATFQVTAEDTVKVTASNEGSSKITINANGKTYTANLTVVGTIEQAPANLDGALELLAATDTSNQNGANVTLQNIEMTTSKPDVATVTTEGIVKCNKVDGGAEAIISAKQGETTRYFKVKSTATLATPTKMDSNKTINGQTTGTANNPIIPKDFYPVNTEKAKWAYDNTNNKVTDVDKGLVIMDEKGNQFVWVPVSNPGSMYGTINGINAGKLYTSWSGTGITGTKSLLNWTETNGVVTRNTSGSGSYREPATLSNYDNGKYTPIGASETKTNLSIITDVIKTKYKSNYEYDNMTNFGNTMQNDFDKMITSVIANGGFYIGRYEASLINNETRVVAGATSMSATEDSANRWYGLYARQRNFADDNGLTSVDSSMIWGSQYDAMINWMQSTGIDVTVTASSSNNTAKNTDANRRTGVVAKDKLNNIYDIFGLRCEWTMEANGTSSRVSRGGVYNLNFSPSDRNYNYPIDTYDSFSSRPTLYIQ